MHILVLQHASCEHPGILRTFLEEDGHTWDAVELDEGETLPSLDGYDALWVMGGPMDVWEEDDHPWLVPEKALIREAVAERGMPFLGLCLGHQLLAEALGGACSKAETPEIGVLDVHVTEQGGESVFFDGMEATMPCLQWHGAEIRTLPDGAVVLATSPLCAVQAMSWGPRAFSAQFHVEIEADTVRNWAEIPTYRKALEDSFGANGVAELDAQCAQHMNTFNTAAERLYINWHQAAARG